MITWRPLSRLFFCASLLGLLSACGGGGGSTEPVSNRAPVAGVAFGQSVRLGTDSKLHASVGETIELNGSASSDADGDSLGFAWSLTSKPAGSNATLQTASSGLSTLVPDVSGEYTIRLTVTDTKGGANSHDVSLVIDNVAPVANVVVASSFTGSTQELPAQNVSTRTSITLDATSSTDAQGQALTVEWALDERPLTSASSLSVSSGMITNFVVDALGTYKVTGRVKDSQGAWVQKRFVFQADNTSPVAGTTVVATFLGDTQTLATQRVNVGSSLALSTASSTDADGHALSTTWTLLDKPVASTAGLSAATGTSTTLSVDTLGIYRVKGRVTDTGGTWSERIFVFNADNRPPTAVASFVATPSSAETQSSQTASLGYDLVLQGQGSTDADGDVLSFSWSMVSRPAGSAATLLAPAASQTGLVPDVLGVYKVRLTATDSKGASSSHLMTINVNNNRPVANVGTNATPWALPFAPTLQIPTGTQLTLRGGNSVDADGDSLTYAWSLLSRPAGSGAVVGSSSSVNASITLDVDGVYVVRLRATDPSGAYSERSITINAGNRSPVLNLDRSRVSAIVGQTVNVSSALSYDPEGVSLTRSWSIDAKPAGSAATLSGAATSSASITPDVAGTYILSATVSDGVLSTTGQVMVVARASASVTVALDFKPLRSRYSKSLDLLVASSASPDSLRIVDPVAQSVRSVPTPKAVRAFNLSPDGRYAAVAQDALLTLVDIANATVVNSVAIPYSPSEVFVTNSGLAYYLSESYAWGTYGGIDLRTGETVSTAAYGAGFVYGAATGIHLDMLGKVLWVNPGLSPTDISYFTYDKATYAFTGGGDSPYHGDYNITSPIWGSEDQTRVYTRFGTMFAGSNLQYGGTLTDSNWIQSLSDSTSQAEVLLLHLAYGSSSTVYPSAIRRYSFPYFAREADLPLPLVGGMQGYGVEVFHSATGKQVLLLQVGSDAVGALGVTHHVVWR